MNTTLSLLSLVASATLLSACAATPGPTAVEQRNMAVVRQAHARLASGDFEAFKDSIGPGYVRHSQAMPPGFQELHGTDEFFAFLQEFLVAVPEYEDSISQMIARGNRVAYVSTMSGVQTGPLGELPPSNKPFTLVNIIIQRLEGGKIVETWVSWDNVAFLTQLGHMPTPPAAG